MQTTIDKGGRLRSDESTAPRLRNNINRWPFFCKIIELIICIIGIVLIVYPFQSEQGKPDVENVELANVSLCGFVLINGVIILCYLIGERQPKRMSMIFSFLGTILCFASGIVLIRDWKNLNNGVAHSYYGQYLKQMLASGIFAVLVSIVFLVDVILTNKYQ